MIDFRGKKVLITGGSRGIGAACVHLFSLTGAEIVFTYTINKEAANQIASKSRGRIKAVKVDLAKEEEIINAVRTAEKFMGYIDILVNNAGIWKYAECDKMTLKEWEETLRINLTGSFLFAREVIPGMKKRRYGKIINIASTAGQRGEAFYSHYAASKGGMISFTKSLAAELGEYNINVNCVAPGWVITDMTKEELNKEGHESAASGIPLGRIAVPGDIAGPVVFLASEISRHITGEILNVNGGSVLCG